MSGQFTCSLIFCRPKDIGKPKAEIAAAFINKRIPGANVIPYPKLITCNQRDILSLM